MKGIEAQKQVRIGAIIKTEFGYFYRREAGSNKWSAEKFISTYALTEEQIIKLQQI